MILAIVFLVISQLILIPIVFQVIKTNNRVLSLFGFIPSSEIKELAVKCEKFIQEFLSQRENDDSLKDEEGEDPDNRTSNKLKQTNNPQAEDPGYELNGEEGSDGKPEHDQ